jgi:hypothetical protein
MKKIWYQPRNPGPRRVSPWKKKNIVKISHYCAFKENQIDSNYVGQLAVYSSQSDRRPCPTASSAVSLDSVHVCPDSVPLNGI